MSEASIKTTSGPTASHEVRFDQSWGFTHYSGDWWIAMRWVIHA